MKSAIFSLFLVAFIAPAFGQQITPNPFPKTITVTGSAEMEVIPDEIYVMVDLKEYEKRGQGKMNIETIKSAFLQSARDIGLPDSAVTIASYEGYNNPWLRKRRKADLYSSIAYQVKFTRSSDIDKMVDRLDDDATQNFRILKTSHSRINEFRKQLKIQAVKSAKDKGTYLTTAIGEQLGEAITIIEPGENFIGYINQLKGENAKLNYQYNEAYTKMGEGRVDSPEALIDFKRIKLRFEVNIIFALK